MIIRVDDINRVQYEAVFQKAYDDLVAAGKIHDDADRFTSLEEFFSHIKDLIDIDKNYVIRIPVDEPTLTIDANKRTIDTSLFTKCINVQSDQIAETVIFSIDRYYDAMDLSNASIWVQWVLPTADDDKSKKGATAISLIDLETEPGKIRFGWPLDTKITRAPGKVQFAVRFFVKKNVSEPALDGGEKVESKVVYSLNTLPATLTIQPALQPELNDEATVNTPDSLFAYAIRNTQYGGKDVKNPQVPSFSAPGTDLPTEATLVEDTLTLLAQAVVGDLSDISYRWTYTSATGNQGEKDVTESGGTVGTAYRRSLAEKRVLSDDYYINSNVTLPEEGQKLQTVYYSHVEADKTAVNAFEHYLGEVFVDENGYTVGIDDKGKTLPLYEKYSAFTVPVEGPVTGTYRCYATASLKAGDNTLTSQEKSSYPCKLVGPSEISIKTPLAERAILILPENAGEDDVEETTLSIEVNRAEGDNSVYTYDWLMSSTSEGELTVVGENESSSFKVTLPGWYSVNAYSSLNRQTNEYIGDKETNYRCKVTKLPKIDTLVPSSSAENVLEDEDTLVIKYIEADSEMALTATATIDGASSFDENDLFSEGLTFTWNTVEIDTNVSTVITEGVTTTVEGNVVSSTLTTKPSMENKRYQCSVINSLNGEVVEKLVEFIVPYVSPKDEPQS